MTQVYSAPLCKLSLQDILCLISDDCTEITLIGDKGEEKCLRRTVYDEEDKVKEVINGSATYDTLFVVKTLHRGLCLKLNMRNGDLICKFRKEGSNIECSVTGDNTLDNTLDIDDMICKDWVLKEI